MKAVKAPHVLFLACAVGALAIGALVDAQRDRLFEATEELNRAADELDDAVHRIRTLVAALHKGITDDRG